MKTCPNCGSKMDPSVNFCTNCGADIRNVPLDSKSSEVKAQASDPTQEVQVEQNTVPSRRSQKVDENTQNDNDSSISSRFSKAVHEFDARNMWNWFVNSWKHPFAEQKAEKWYGWVTLLIEDLLFCLGLIIIEYRTVDHFNSPLISNSMNILKFYNSSFKVVIELLFFIILTQIAWIGAAYLSYKIIYNKDKDLMEFTNRVVQTSNLSAIFMVIYFIFMVIPNVGISATMIILTIIFFIMALTVVILGEPNPVHDKFYGYLLFIAIQFVISLILIYLIDITIISQNIGSYIGW